MPRACVRDGDSTVTSLRLRSACSTCGALGCVSRGKRGWLTAGPLAFNGGSETPVEAWEKPGESLG
ncbi:hypothetical protein N658DRAFT_500255 [Parathielavia hyrcaniae]|uniref:Uncharacterized protein n=1 Tax=Parathielavia hyrcaniae TaxID=113614 RepID=A0AAN6PTM0_9PEZI|nr:hypothetical protein N658DRAFT_500255 [Parathielavia hyrcaniae]